MNRRNFLSLFGAGVAGIALEQAIPFNRVWSFPKEIVIAPFDFGPNYLRAMRHLNNFFLDEIDPAEWRRSFAIGQTINVRVPQRYVVTRSDSPSAS